MTLISAVWGRPHAHGFCVWHRRQPRRSLEKHIRIKGRYFFCVLGTRLRRIGGALRVASRDPSLVTCPAKGVGPALVRARLARRKLGPQLVDNDGGCVAKALVDVGKADAACAEWSIIQCWPVKVEV
jgi:hypothetical protein